MASKSRQSLRCFVPFSLIWIHLITRHLIPRAMIIKITLGDVCFFLLRCLTLSLFLKFAFLSVWFFILGKRLKSMSDENMFLNYSKSVVGTMNEAIKFFESNTSNEMSAQRVEFWSVLWYEWQIRYSHTVFSRRRYCFNRQNRKSQENHHQFKCWSFNLIIVLLFSVQHLVQIFLFMISPITTFHSYGKNDFGCRYLSKCIRSCITFDLIEWIRSENKKHYIRLGEKMNFSVCSWYLFFSAHLQLVSFRRKRSSVISKKYTFEWMKWMVVLQWDALNEK